MSDIRNYTMIILCGGRGSRMNGTDKGLLPLHGHRFIDVLLQRFTTGPNPPGKILISANRHLETYARRGCRVIPDRLAGGCGPLAGIEACLPFTGDGPVIVIPCDTPLVRPDLPARLLERLVEPQSISVAHDGTRLQALFMAFQARQWHQSLRSYLKQGGRSVQGWLQDKPLATVLFDDAVSFCNINDPSSYHALTGQNTGQLATATGGSHQRNQRAAMRIPASRRTTSPFR